MIEGRRLCSLLPNGLHRGRAPNKTQRGAALAIARRRDPVFGQGHPEPGCGVADPESVEWEPVEPLERMSLSNGVIPASMEPMAGLSAAGYSGDPDESSARWRSQLQLQRPLAHARSYRTGHSLALGATVPGPLAHARSYGRVLGYRAVSRAPRRSGRRP